MHMRCSLSDVKISSLREIANELKACFHHSVTAITVRILPLPFCRTGKYNSILFHRTKGNGNFLFLWRSGIFLWFYFATTKFENGHTATATEWWKRALNEPYLSMVYAQRWAATFEYGNLCRCRPARRCARRRGRPGCCCEGGCGRAGRQGRSAGIAQINNKRTPFWTTPADLLRSTRPKYVFTGDMEKIIEEQTAGRRPEEVRGCVAQIIAPFSCLSSRCVGCKLRRIPESCVRSCSGIASAPGLSDTN